jgi:ABC-type spermidine/putrescine transport system permease subunit II
MMDNKTITILTSLWKAITLTALIFGLILLFFFSLTSFRRLYSLYFYVFFVIVAIVVGLCSGAMAKHKGKKKVIWPIFYGMTWGMVAFIYYAVSPKIEKSKENN